ncbi:MAG: dTDP-glucose 4,6-dehydratase [Promethearchaeota archaeon]
MYTILVTGGMGFIGSNFIRFVLNSDTNMKVVNVDKLTYAGNLENLKDVEKQFQKRYIFYRGDICNFKRLNKIFLKEKIDFIINFAAESHVDRSIQNPSIFCKTNVLGTQTLLNLARIYEIQRYIQISTDEVYGALTMESPPFIENTPLAPNSPYSASKASADLLVRAYYKTFNLPTIITRCSNNYGPYQYPEKLIPLMILNALNNKKLPIYGDGLNIRDWIHVEDHCQAIKTVLMKGKIGEVYNIGGDCEISNIELVRKILKILNKPESLITFVKDRPGHDFRYSINHEKITRELNWKPKITLEEGLKSTIDWYLNNKNWLNNLINRKFKKFYDKQYKKR